MIELSLSDLLSVLIAFTALALSVGAWVRSGMTPQQVDINATNRLEEMRKDREHMATMERSYQQAGEFQKQALNTLAGVLSTVAPMTKGFQFDDAAARYLSDVRTPGVPAMTDAKTVGAVAKSDVEAANAPD